MVQIDGHLREGDPKISDRDFITPQGVTSIPVVREVLDRIAEEITALGDDDLRGLSYRVEGLAKWPKVMGPIHFATTLALAKTLDPKECHPVQQYLICRELNEMAENIKEELVNDFKYKRIGELLASEADYALALVGNNLEERITGFTDDFSRGDFSKKELLQALTYPYARIQTFDHVFNALYQERLFSYFYDLGLNEMSLTPPESWSYISKFPRDIVEFLSELNPDPQGRLVDLGCGKGGALFQFAALTDLSITGVDIDPSLISSADSIAAQFPWIESSFHMQDVRSVNLSSFDIIYIYTPFMNRTPMLDLVKNVERGCSGREAKVWCVSYMELVNIFREQDWLEERGEAGGITEFVTV